MGDMMVDAKPALDLVEIVEKSSSLSERLSGMFAPKSMVNEETLGDIEAKLQLWCQNAARGDWHSFRKRLSWDDLDIDTVRRILGPVTMADGHPLPNWITTLDEAVSSATLSTGSLPADDRCLDGATPVPFEELWLPFVRVARRRLANRVGSHCEILSGHAFAELERELLRTLSTIGSQSLYVEFTVLQALRQPARLLALAGPTPSEDKAPNNLPRGLYVEFVQHMLAGGLSAFFQEYSVVGRLASITTDQWVDSTAEFLNRLAADLPDIQYLFGGGTELGTVVDVTPGLSDPHRHGRSVIAARFASGLKLIYKPRDIGIEAAYNKLLAWLNEQGMTPAFKVLKVLNRPTHGWVEFVEQLPCRTEEEAALYYHRAGMLMGLLYALHGSDCHDGNLIACGPHPVLIDLEVLLNPTIAEEIQDDDRDSVQILAAQQFRNSVLTSGLLPIWNRAPDGTAYDVSGFGGRVDGVGVRRPQWHYVNSDQMTLVRQKQAIPATSAIPYLNQNALSPNDYLEQILAGFQQMYRFFLNQRAAILAAGGPLAAFRHCRARFVFRNTSLYDQLRKLAVAPKHMKDGVEHSIHLDLVSRALVFSDTKPKFWPILAEEIRALEQMDIPLLSMYTDDTAIISDDSRVVVADAFVDDGYRLTIRTLDDLDEADMELQSGFIRASLYTRLIGGADHQAQVGQTTRHLGELIPLTPAQLVEEAAAIADALLKSAIRSGKGLTWITLEYSAELERYELKPLGHSLYSGLSGIALFFGALAKATGERSYRDLAVAAVHDLRTDLAHGDLNRAARLGSRLGLGSALGIGAVSFVFARLSQFLGDDELAAEARRAAALLTLPLIANDQCPDVFTGSAGAILGLLTLYDLVPDQSLLDQALACGQHLLDTRVAHASGYRAWVTLNDACLTGFSHGAAGIAYALLRLYEKASDSQFLEAAREAIAYERSVFSPNDGNWPDFRFPESVGPKFTTSWCHGAPGIALARIGGLKQLDSPEIREDIDVALETTRKVALVGGGVDHLCCGTLGRVETLLKAGQVLSRPDFTETALRVATSVVRMAEQRGAYCLFAELPDGVDNPGFFQGTSGIGYELLRLAYPGMFPSVLIWE